MSDRLLDLGTIFLSIVLQSLPFVLVGVFAAAGAELYLSDRLLARWLPGGRLRTLLLAGLLGLAIPVCDCGVIPFARRLIARGAPVYAGVTLILAAPVVNPVVALATAVAFQGSWRVVALRLGMSLSVALAVGLLAGVVFREPARATGLPRPILGASDDQPPPASPLRRLLLRANAEFFDVIFYVVLGAFFTATAQTFVPRTLLNTVGADRVGSILVLMPLASLLSICSEADAFVARALAGSFSPGSIFAFMVIGQVVDLRNGLVLIRTLGPRYVVLIAVSAYLLVFAEALLINSVVHF